MADVGVIGHGVKVAFSTSSPVSWTALGELADFTPPTLERNKADNTVHGTSPFMRELPAMIKVGDTSMVIVADQNTRANYLTLKTHFLSGATLWWRFETPADRAITTYYAREIQGFIANLSGPMTPQQERQTYEVTITFDGDSVTDYPAAGASAIA